MDVFGLNKWQGCVWDFMVRARQHVGASPKKPTIEQASRRSTWLIEEALEAQKAAVAGDIPGLARELVDVIYVACGTANDWGIDLGPVFDAVHEGNMEKLRMGAAVDADGKVKKPEGWTPPPLFDILQQQGWAG
jgi:predicted HAD superfamily Cof-like phosphohydrolase